MFFTPKAIENTKDIALSEGHINYENTRLPEKDLFKSLVKKKLNFPSMEN